MSRICWRLKAKHECSGQDQWVCVGSFDAVSTALVEGYTVGRGLDVLQSHMEVRAEEDDVVGYCRHVSFRCQLTFIC